MTKSTRRNAWLIAAATLLAWASGACAQAAYPDHAVRVVVPFAAGSFTDVAARAIGAELQQQLGQAFVVDPRGGAGSTIGTEIVAKAPADGYTLLFTDNSFPVSSALYSKLPYDPAKDIVQITTVAEAPTVIVVRDGLPARTLKELVDLARAKPGILTFGSGGQGSSANLGMELFLEQAGIKMTHVPYRGVAAALADVVAGRIDVGLASIGSAGPHITGGRVRALAIVGKSRSPQFPNVPTFAESGYPDYNNMYWFGFMAPAGTPAAIVVKLQQDITKALASPKVKQMFASVGAVPVPMTPADYTARVKAETATWRGVIERAGIKPE
jgi:tripartite-type tricarboxylate transporter receptor subunit TctC